MSDYEKQPKFLNLGYILKSDEGRYSVQLRAFGMENTFATLSGEDYIEHRVKEGMNADSAERLRKGQEKMGLKYVITKESAKGNLLSVGSILNKDGKTKLILEHGQTKLYASAQDLTEKDLEYSPENAYKRILLVVDQ